MNKSLLASSLLALVLAVASPARADSVTYTFTGGNVLTGTNFTYVSPSGFLSFGQAIVPTTATDLYYDGDLGKLTLVYFYDATDIILYSGTPPVSSGCCGGNFFQLDAYTPSESLGGGTTLSILPTATPEPSSLAMLGTGIACIARTIRRRIRKS